MNGEWEGGLTGGGEDDNATHNNGVVTPLLYRQLKGRTQL